MDRTILPGEDQRGHEVALKKGDENQKSCIGWNRATTTLVVLFSHFLKETKNKTFTFTLASAKSDTQISSQVQVPDG